MKMCTLFWKNNIHLGHDPKKSNIKASFGKPTESSANPTLHQQFQYHKQERTRQTLFSPGRMGFSLEGNRVSRIITNSQAANAGVKVGWTIVRVNGKIKGPDHDEIAAAIRATHAYGKATSITFKITNEKHSICNGPDISQLTSFFDNVFPVIPIGVLQHISGRNLQLHDETMHKIMNGSFILLSHFSTKNMEKVSINNRIQEIQNLKELVIAFTRWSILMSRVYPVLTNNVRTSDDHQAFLLFFLCLIEENVPFSKVLHFVLSTLKKKKMRRETSDGLQYKLEPLTPVDMVLLDTIVGPSQQEKNETPSGTTNGISETSELLSLKKYELSTSKVEKDISSGFEEKSEVLQIEQSNAKKKEPDPKHLPILRHSSTVHNLSIDQRTTLALSFYADAQLSLEPRLTNLWFTRVYRNSFYHSFSIFIVICHLMLSFHELPTNQNRSFEQYIQSERSTIFGFETGFIIFYAFDLWLEFQDQGLHFKNWRLIRPKSRRDAESIPLLNRWMGNSIISFFLLLDVILEFSWQGYYIRVFRFLRPFKLVLLSTTTFRTVSSMVATLPYVWDVVLLIIVLLLFFGIAGVHVFWESYPEWNIYDSCEQILPNGTHISRVINETVIVPDNFNNIGWSMLTLVVLSTTESWPDAGRPAYAQSPFTVIYFVVYLTVMILFVLSVPVSILYEGFKKNLEKELSEEASRQERCLYGAFYLLDSNGDDLLSSEELTDFLVRAKKIIVNEDTVVESYFRKLDATNDGTVDLDEFCTLCDVLLYEPKKRGGKHSGFLYMANLREKILKVVDLKKFAQSSHFRASVFFAVITQAIILALYDASALAGTSRKGDILDTIDSVLMWFFILEAIIKIIGLGVNKYWEDGWNKFDFFLVSISALTELAAPYIGDLFSAGAGRSMRIVRVTKLTKLSSVLKVGRAIRIFRLFSSAAKSFHRLDIIITKVARAMGGVFPTLVVMMLVFYLYALLAGELFSKYFENQQCTEWYDQMANFETFGATILTLFQVFTTSNWHEILYNLWSATEHISGYKFVCIAYIFSFYFMTVLWITNLILALVWEMHTKSSDPPDNSRSSTSSPRRSMPSELVKRRKTIAMHDVFTTNSQHFSKSRRTRERVHVSKAVDSASASMMLKGSKGGGSRFIPSL